ncbi:Rrf2 family transcriptional regulator [uncultured Thermanaerothrix sp.]|uniref:RrF2 family transcriptional regulator n=1 Tax=uncultured Thermanaerothrix sp. TaxID=1195149 RepID=UPI0026047663|nr:Rrf2 family transcriptional regulator [uncultured Thermanaerothrix sp.]
MLKISRRLDYGLQIMLALAKMGDRPVATALLSRDLDIPLPFTHQIAHTLMQKGLVKTIPGPRGGIRLSRSPDAISLREIMEALEGPIRLSPCLEDTLACPHYSTCVFLPIWTNLQANINEALQSLTLSKLVNQTPQQILREVHALSLPVEICEPGTAS